MAFIKRQEITSVDEDVGILVHYWWECKLVQPLWKTVGRFLRKLKVELSYETAIPLLGIYPKKTKSLILINICTPMFITALFTVAKIWKQPKCPLMDEWMKKTLYIYTYTHTRAYYSASKKNEILPIVTMWLNLINQ